MYSTAQEYALNLPMNLMSTVRTGISFILDNPLADIWNMPPSQHCYANISENKSSPSVIEKSVLLPLMTVRIRVILRDMVNFKGLPFGH